MRFRRSIFPLLLCALLTLPAAAASARTSADQVSLTLGLWDQNQVPAEQTIIKQFEHLHPNIKVTIQQTPWAGYWNKLTTLTAGGSGYDVFWMNGPNFPTYASKGALLDQTPYLNAAHINLATYPPALLSLYNWKGRQYGLVKDFDTIGLFYNKNLFDNAHVAYPTCQWTWQDYVNAAVKLTVKSGGRTTQYGTMVYNTLQQIYGGLFAAYGGSILNSAKTRSVIASPQNIQAANLLQSMITAGTALPGTSTTALTEDLAFESGKIAMVLDGSWMVLPYTSQMSKGYKAGVTCLPSGPKGRFSVIHGLGMVVNAHTAHPAEASAFAEFLAGPYAAQVQAQTGTVIPALNGSQKPWVASRPALDLPVFLSETKNAVPYPASLGYNEWYNPLTTDFDLMLLGKKSVKDTLTQVQSQMNTVLTQYYPHP
jgi:multiple sugar transport system substrate-binding protein